MCIYICINVYVHVKNVYICIYMNIYIHKLNHFALHPTLTHCKSAVCQLAREAWKHIHHHP